VLRNGQQQSRFSPQALGPLGLGRPLKAFQLLAAARVPHPLGRAMMEQRLAATRGRSGARQSFQLCELLRSCVTLGLGATRSLPCLGLRRRQRRRKRSRAPTAAMAPTEGDKALELFELVHRGSA